jgi:aminoglycoside phosphotransferase (APT) family kinase protein
MRTAPAGIEVFERPPDWLLNAVDGNQVAEALRALPEVRAAGHLSSCQAVDLRLSKAGWSVWYDVTMATVDAGDRLITLTGSLDPARIVRPGISEASPASQVVLPFGDNGWSATLQGLGLMVHTAPGDGRLPALALLTDPGRARTLLEHTIDQQAYPGIRISACEPRVVRYSRGVRATLVVPLHYGPDADPSWPDAVVAKVHRSDAGAHAFAALRALGETDLSCGRVVTIPEALAYMLEHRVLVQRVVPKECSLTDLLVAVAPNGAGPGMEQLLIALRRTADGLVALHSCGVHLGEERTHVALLRRLGINLGRLERIVPSVAGVANQLIDHLERRARDVPSDSPRPAHGSFRPAQVLVRAGGVAFIDFDGCCMAEPANDIGRFRARLREVGLAAPGGRLPPLSAARRAVLDELADVFLDRYEEQCTVNRERVALWEDLELTTALVQTWTHGKLNRIPTLLSLLGH